MLSILRCMNCALRVYMHYVFNRCIGWNICVFCIYFMSFHSSWWANDKWREREKKTVIPLLGTTLPSHCHVFSMLMSYFKYFYWNFIAHHKWPYTLRVVQVQFASCILNLYIHWTSIFMMLNAISMSIFLMCLYDFSSHESHERWKDLVKNDWEENKYVWLHLKWRQIHFIHIYRDIIRKKQERERELHLTVCKANKNIFDKQSH